MRTRRLLGLLLVSMAGFQASTASAVAVGCGGTAGQLRVLTISPAEVGGLCAAIEGNFNPAAGVGIIAAATGLTTSFLDKDQNGDTDTTNEAWLTGFTDNATSGNWTVSDAAWNVYQRLFLGFHFGNNNGAGDAANPDSFFVELARSDNTGTWSLGGTGAVLNGLSHIDLFGAGSCTAAPAACKEDTPPVSDAPEPGSLALAGLALLGAVVARRRQA